MLSLLCECPPSAPLSNKVRDDFIALVSDGVREDVAQLFQSLTELEAFHKAVQNLQTACGVLVRNPDKKRRQAKRSCSSLRSSGPRC